MENPPIVSKRVLEAIKQPFSMEGEDFYLTASIGIGLYPVDGKDEATLIKRAGSAKDFAITQGKNNYLFFSR